MNGTEQISIMPLVEENRQLHERIKLLQHQLEEQNVRVDRVLEMAPKLLSKVTLEVTAAHQMMTMDRGKIIYEAARELAMKLFAQNLVTKVFESNGDLRFEVYFLGARK